MKHLLTSLSLLVVLPFSFGCGQVFVEPVVEKACILKSEPVVKVNDNDGEEVQIHPHSKYRFTCLIYQLEKNVEWGHGKWQANAKFIASEDKKLIHIPELVE